jgi:peptidoglycan/LPS O-acetylase OafA/YrhL
MKILKLEAIRGFAALYVLIHHFIGFTVIREDIPDIVRFPFRFGQEAVILFFLMSGFVIYLSSIHNSDLTFPQYFKRRFIRIYPIAICSFLLSILLFWINGYHFTFSDLQQLIGNMCMLQDTDNKPGSFVLPFLKNDPLWSLSYEWWFYLLFFPLFVFYYKKRKTSLPSIYLILVISIVSWILYILHPNHFLLILSYFVMWWAGVSSAEVYLKHKNFTFSNMFPVLVSMGIMTCLSAFPILQSYMEGNRRFSQIMYPVLIFRHFGFALVVLTLGIVWHTFKLKYYDFFLQPFERFSSISYAIYILHFPFVWLKIPSVHPYVAIAMKLVVIFLLSYLLETKMQPEIVKIFKNKPKRD